jgi:hypothetical protein
VGGVSGLLLLTLLVVVLAAWPSREGPPGTAQAGTGEPAPVFDQGPAVGRLARATRQGGLRVVVHPWAEVLLGGRVVETTPFDRPLILPAGTHRVVLRHPNLGRVTRAVKIRAGKVLTLRVDITEKGAKP